jgi:hypothetical protein
MQGLRVEVLHRSGRAQAAAAALAAGASSQDAQQQELLLGTATAPLADLLAKPQASTCSWLC